MRTHMRVLTLAILVSFLVLAVSCGDSGGTTPPPPTPTPTPAVSVTITPSTPSISVTETVTFTATVANTSNHDVTWTASAGTVEAGVFTPPMHAGTYTVTATSAADTTKSASATVTVTAPAPVFSGTPAPTASEGKEYQFQVAATDPVGTEVTFELTTGPTGAALDETNLLNWTPADGQGRQINQFIVTATSAAGGVNTLKWDVNTLGTIKGTVVDRYWLPDGEYTDVPRDMTGYDIGAYIPIPESTIGETENSPGEGNADGTFTVPDVPAGKYWLYINGDVFWTDSSTFDYGTDFTGRPTDEAAVVNTTIQWNLFGLSPQQNCCYGAEVLTPLAGAAIHSWDIFDANSTVFSMTDPERAVFALDGETDKSYVIQMDDVSESSGMDGYAASITSAMSLDLTTVNGGVTPVEGQMGGQPQVFGLSIDGGKWSQQLLTAGPGITSLQPVEAELSVLPFVTDNYAYVQMNDPGFFFKKESSFEPGLPVAYMQSPEVASVNQELGNFPYLNPYPAEWKTLFGAQQFANAPVYVPGSSTPADLTVEAAFLTDQMPEGPIAPLMSGVKNPKINGKNLFAANTIDISEEALTLTWEPPTGLAPAGYEVTVYVLFGDELVAAGGYGPWQQFYTSETSIAIPYETIWSGMPHAFMIRAMADTRANFAVSPWRMGLPMADASIVSGPQIIEGGLSVETALVSKIKAARTNLNSQKAAKSAQLKQRHARSFLRMQKPVRTTK